MFIGVIKGFSIPDARFWNWYPTAVPLFRKQEGLRLLAFFRSHYSGIPVPKPSCFFYAEYSFDTFGRKSQNLLIYVFIIPTYNFLYASLQLFSFSLKISLILYFIWDKYTTNLLNYQSMFEKYF